MDVRAFAEAGNIAGPTRSPFRARLTEAVQEAVLIGVKWAIVSLLALMAVGWVLRDYADIREQAQWIARVRQAQAQAAAQPAASRPPAAAPGGP